MVRIRDSKSCAKNHSRDLSNSTAPMNATFRTSSASSSVGSAHFSTPRIARLPGISITTPSETLTSVGVPQPIFAIGPIRNFPCSGGKKARRSLRIRGALATTSCGNITDSIRPVRTPSTSAWRFIPRLRPIRPPTASRVKPYPSCRPGPPNSVVITISIEKPSLPSGIRVLIRPIALRSTNPANFSSSAPEYSPRAGSADRKPPPEITPVSTERPIPVGGLNSKPMSSGPRLPPSRNRDLTITPTRSTAALTGPSSALKAAEISSGTEPSAPIPALRYSVVTSIGPSSRWVGIARSSEPLPSSRSPPDGDQSARSSKSDSIRPPPVILLMKPSPWERSIRT